jgi:HlyD family secretion protein
VRQGFFVRPRVWLSLLFVIALGIAAWKLIQWRNQPPPVTFARAERQTLVSSVSTNGKVEPAEYGTARAEVSGPVEQILVDLRQQVSAGAPLVVIDSSRARSELETANARIREARAQLEAVDRGGRSADLAALQSEIDTSRVALEQARRDYNSLSALRAKQAATQTEVNAAKDQVEQLEAQIRSLEQRKSALVSPADREAAQARLREAEAARSQAELQIQKSTVRAPLAGVIYQFDIKRGAYLNPGDLVASIGRLDPVHVNVFVDEPDLGRVHVGKTVTITWDAKPGLEWMGTVDRMPTRIVELGTRQVGEVVTVIGNPQLDLLPGTNVTVNIVAETVESAISIPKEALFRQQDKTGVYLLQGDQIRWQPVTPAVSNVTRVQVSELKEGDLVALPSSRELVDGMVVRPIAP